MWGRIQGSLTLVQLGNWPPLSCDRVLIERTTFISLGIAILWAALRIVDHERMTLSAWELPSFELHGGSLIYQTNSSHWPQCRCAISLWRVSRKVVTWLILPVVICLSQRLSHACLSINNFVLWNCEWLIKSVIVYLMLPCYMDNCGNSRANTCNQAPTSGRGVFIR